VSRLAQQHDSPAPAGSKITHGVEVFLASVCTRHLTDKLALVGFVSMRRTD
jgi:hypothetical protein